MCFKPIRLTYRTNSDVSFRYVPCGRCLGCQRALYTDWVHRLCHEFGYHKQSCSFTLTLDDDHLRDYSDSDPRPIQLFFKRLRKRIGVPVKYFVAMEYGSARYRKHYHVLLFGWSPPNNDMFLSHWRTRRGQREPVFASHTICDSWGSGLTDCQPLTKESILYAAKYVQKIYMRRYWFSIGLSTPFTLKSQGLGKRWCLDHHDDLLANGVFFQDKYCCRLPRYYNKILDRYFPNRRAFSDPSHFRELRNAKLVADSAAVGLSPVDYYRREMIAKEAVAISRQFLHHPLRSVLGPLAAVYPENGATPCRPPPRPPVGFPAWSPDRLSYKCAGGDPMPSWDVKWRNYYLLRSAKLASASP